MEHQDTRDTDDFVYNQSIRQGRVKFVRQNNVLKCDAEGPFNEELIEAVGAVEFGLIAELTANGKWADIVVIRENAYASSRTLESFNYFLGILVAQKIAPTATALVMASDVLDSDVMRPKIIDAYQQNGLTVNSFDNEDVAMDWVLKQLGQ